MLDLARPWTELPLVVLDFETTGVDPLECAPVSVAAVRFESGKEVSSFYSLLRPGREIPEGASQIHGITDDMVKDAPELADVAHELLRVGEGALPCAFHAIYDRTILHRFISGADCPLFDPAQEWACPLVVIREVDRYVRGQGRHKLTACCERWGIEIEEAHNALSDARAAGRLLWTLHERRQMREYPARKLLEVIAEKRAQQDADFASYKARSA